MSRRLALALACAVALPAARASADPITLIDFNSLPNNANNAAVGTYLASYGISVTGALAQTGYDGDGHAVGPVSGHTVTSLTLGSTDGGVQHGGDRDTFLVNDNLNHSYDRITMTFSHPIYSLSFDYEIFPNANSNRTPYPDFTVLAGGTMVFHQVAGLPTAPLLHSPASGWNGTELYSQFLGQADLTFANGVTQIQFVDWPTLIGIDNVRFSSSPPANDTGTPTPEPATVATWGLALVGLGFVAVRARRGAKPATAA